MNYMIAGFDFCSVFLLLIFCLSDGVAFLMDEVGGNYFLHFTSNLLSYLGADIVLIAFTYYVVEEINGFTNISRIYARIVLVACAADFFKTEQVNLSRKKVC